MQSRPASRASRACPWRLAIEFKRQLLRPFVLFENVKRPGDDDFRAALQFAAPFKRALTHVAGAGDDGKGIFYGCV
ncbi:hypothetical protein F3P66_06090 [Agrobacterium fabrum]|uniref:Uncharacterized protein n=1 Tax=Agrobacterium fabrum (strain C58 / ATCC 33970) TaxID=176299 RepID=Q8U596_AGRFC|nr:hypothetical protein Atu1639 [Agrobacterium fabrum str. C58]QKW96892.1 hypothetical protein GSF67_07185 [Agrobacterium sp. CGMCC 11546]QRM59055.1 hypothetical protein F3P66_06090 [Agrobacterium fabrum]TRB26967.1 hypothetical protein EXN51_20975 [Agrobacterium fabrum]